MGGLRTLALMLWLCSLLADRISPAGTGDVTTDVETPAVTMVLTAFSVDDESLELSYKVMNGSDHDVWICEDLHVSKAHGPYNPKGHEVYMGGDARTLVIRKRLEVPLYIYGELLSRKVRYVRLSPGQERTWTLSLEVPVKPRTVFSSRGADATCAKRVVLEIGFYDEDLPGKIRRILDVADKLECAPTLPSEIGVAPLYDTYLYYFPGLRLSSVFGGLSGFSSVWQPGSEQIDIPHLWPVTLGESCLQVELDGVFIPYARY